MHAVAPGTAVPGGWFRGLENVLENRVRLEQASDKVSLAVWY